MRTIIATLCMFVGLLAASPIHAESFHATISKTAKAELKAFATLKKRLRRGESPCGMGIQSTWQSVITRVSTHGSSNGFEPGDFILAVNGIKPDEDQAMLYFSENFSAGDQLNVSVLRAGDKLDLDVVCTDDTGRLQAVFNLLQSAVKQKWQRCVDRSYLVDEISGGESSATAFYRGYCMEAIRCDRQSCKDPTVPDAESSYKYIVLALAEARLVESGVNTIQSDVLVAIDWLTENGFGILATDLEARLEAALNEPEPQKPQAITGTCFAVSEREIITSAHVVKHADFVTVEFQDGRQTWADIKRLSPTSDLALLVTYEDTPAILPLLAGETLSVGKHIFTLKIPETGMAEGKSKLLKGTVSSDDITRGDTFFFQVSMPINPQNIGAPVVDKKGRVIGVLAANVAVESLPGKNGMISGDVSWATKADDALSLLDTSPQDTKRVKRSKAIKRARSALCKVRAVLGTS